MATNRFYSKTKMAAGSQERHTLKRSYIAWQWDRDFVPQNVFLVSNKLLNKSKHSK